MSPAARPRRPRRKPSPRRRRVRRRSRPGRVDSIAVELVREDFDVALELLRAAGFRLDVIYPADDPHTALLSFGSRTVRLAKPSAAPLPDGLPQFRPEFVLTRAGESSAQGRAGMLYRDLIPGRLGGRYIASHITIPGGGAVADWVHYHRILIQVIFVRRGWVRVVYDGQGEPFVMEPGDLVLQPPGIRHRVLESSPGLEVIEIGAPALHETFADHELVLPNPQQEDRTWSGQRFLRHRASHTPWIAFNRAEARETGLSEATGGLADARTIRRGQASELRFPPHDGELVFGCVLAGTAKLEYESGLGLVAADAFVIPPEQSWGLSEMSGDLTLLHVTTARLDAAA